MGTLSAPPHHRRAEAVDDAGEGRDADDEPEEREDGGVLEPSDLADPGAGEEHHHASFAQACGCARTLARCSSKRHARRRRVQGRGDAVLRGVGVRIGLVVGSGRVMVGSGVRLGLPVGEDVGVALGVGLGDGQGSPVQRSFDQE